MIPDAEVFVGAYLRTHSAVVPLTSRVSTGTPANTDTTWVRLSELDGRGGPLDYLVNFLLQLDCYAGKMNGHGEAKDLGLAVRDALGDMPGGTYSGAVVSGVELSGGPLIDTDGFEPARERYIVEARLWAHTA